MNGGKTNIYNGSIVNELAHRYIHSLPREDEEVINDMIRHYKLTGGVLVSLEEGLQLTDSIQIDLDFDMSDTMSIPVYDNTKEDYEKRKKFNRAKMKRETQQFIDDELEFMEELDSEER